MEYQTDVGYEPWKMPWQTKYVVLAAVVFFELARAGVNLLYKDSNSIPEKTLEEKAQVVRVEEVNDVNHVNYSSKHTYQQPSH